MQTPGFSPPVPAPAKKTPAPAKKTPALAKKTPAPGKKLRLRQKTCEMLDTEVLKSTTQTQ